MSIKWVDVSIPLHPGTVVWPGDEPFVFKPAGRISEGASCNTSRMELPTHLGTHCDAPWHFEEDGKKLDEVNTDLFFGDVLLVELPNVDIIRGEDLGEKPFPERVIFKTKNSHHPEDAPFNKEFVALHESAAQRLVDDGVKLVGIDYLSIAPYGNSGPTHHILLQNGVFVVEGLRLANFGSGIYSFVVLPLPLVGADGAPCRAFLGRT